MKGFLCITNAKNDEEYRAALKKRNWIFAVTAVIGVALAVVSYFVCENELVEMSAKSLGFLSGAGAGLAGGSIALIIKNSVLLKNEKKLKAERIANSDERIAAIAQKAHSTAFTIMAIVLCGGLLIGGVFYPILIEVFAAVVFIWAFSYTVSFLIYNRKM